MLPPTAVVFDLDGTLIDSRGDIVAATNHALLATGRKPEPAAAILPLVGDGARSLCARIAKLDESAKETDELVEHFLSYYEEHPIDFTRLMPFAMETMETLAAMERMVLGLCTNKHRRATDAVLSALGIADRFAVVVAGGDLPQKKPDPAPLRHIAKTLGVLPPAIVMVGDGPQDILCAQQAGCWSIAVECGFSSASALAQAGPDVLLKDLGMLAGTVQRWREPTTKIRLR